MGNDNNGDNNYNNINGNYNNYNNYNNDNKKSNWNHGYLEMLFLKESFEDIIVINKIIKQLFRSDVIFSHISINKISSVDNK